MTQHLDTLEPARTSAPVAALSVDGSTTARVRRLIVISSATLSFVLILMVLLDPGRAYARLYLGIALVLALGGTALLVWISRTDVAAAAEEDATQ